MLVIKFLFLGYVIGRPRVPNGRKSRDNVWECVEAQGKFCYLDEERAGNNMGQANAHLRYNTEKGAGFCCHPADKNVGCVPTNSYYGFGLKCSAMPSDGSDASYAKVLTDGVNHQVMAYNPMAVTNQKTCGLGDNAKNYDMSLTPAAEDKTVAVSGMKFVDNANPRQYAACYYEIKGTGGGPIHFTLKKKSGVDLYIYQGKDRANAKESIVPLNAQALAGIQYSAPGDTGILVVAFAKKGRNLPAGDFEFAYGEVPPAGLFGLGMVVEIIIAVVVLVLIAVVIGVCVMKKKAQVADGVQMSNQVAPKGV